MQRLQIDNKKHVRRQFFNFGGCLPLLPFTIELRASNNATTSCGRAHWQLKSTFSTFAYVADFVGHLAVCLSPLSVVFLSSPTKNRRPRRAVRPPVVVYSWSVQMENLRNAFSSSKLPTLTRLQPDKSLTAAIGAHQFRSRALACAAGRLASSARRYVRR